MKCGGQEALQPLRWSRARLGRSGHRSRYMLAHRVQGCLKRIRTNPASLTMDEDSPELQERQ